MKLFQNIAGPNKLVLIFVQLNKDGNSYFSVLVRSKNKIADNEIRQFDAMESLVKHHGLSKAYWIHVSGSGVLSRLVDRASGYKEDIIINGDKDDFMFSSFTDGEKSIVSFVRKNTLDQIREELKNLKTHVLGISCGPIPTLLLLENSESIEAEFKITLKQGLISDFVRNDAKQETLLFRNEYVSEKQLIASAIYTNLQANKEGFEFCLAPEETTFERNEYNQHRRFTVFGVSSVISILLIVLVNYFYINHLNNEVAQLETDLSMSNDNLSLLDRLEQEKARKEQLIETSGISGNNFISYYLDKIGQSVSPTIYLRNMVVFPVEEKLKEKRKVTVDTKKIEIEGLTNSSVVFDDWIEKMNRFEWVKSVEVLNYTKINDSQAEFKLIMVLGI